MSNFMDMTQEQLAQSSALVVAAAPSIFMVSYSDFGIPEGYAIKFANRWSIVTNWGFGSASSNNDISPFKSPPPAIDMEVVVISPGGSYLALPCYMKYIDGMITEPTACDGLHEPGFALHRVTTDRLAAIMFAVSVFDPAFTEEAEAELTTMHQ